jgi:polyferredoxin
MPNYKIIGSDGKEYSNVTPDQVHLWLNENRVNAQTKVLPEGATEWVMLSEIPEFATAWAADVPVAPGTISLGPGPAAKNNPMAVTGMIMGILSITCVWCCYGLPFNLLGIIFSAIALSQIQKSPTTQKGRGMAIAGLVLAILGVILGVVFALMVPWNDIIQKLQKMQPQ